MGLDMYLTQKFYVKNWDHMKDGEKHEISILKGGVQSRIPTERICYIETEEVYWRKNNAIHKWFVDNVQSGEDDCGSYGVSYEQLIELKELCEKIVKANDEGKLDEVKDELETSGGFFFGGTDYDDGYIEDLKQTIEIVNKITKHEVANKLIGKSDGFFGSHYEYSSSW